MRRIVVFSCVLVLLVSCGGKPWSEAASGGSPGARLLSAVTRTTNAHTADMAMDIKMSISMPGGGKQSIDMSGAGRIDFTGRKADLKFEASAAGVSEQIEMRVVGGTVYEFQNGEWSVAGKGADADDTAMDGSFDPTQYLQYLNGISSDVHVVGSSTIDGTPVTTYAGTIDTQTLLSSPSLSQSQREQVQTALSALGAKISSMPFTAALDDQGRLRKLTLSMEVSIEGATAHMDLTMSYSNFGTAVNITPPPGFENNTPTSVSRSSNNRAVQSDLRNALVAEKTYYTDQQHYSASVDDMATIEGSLDWGGTLHVAVSKDKQTVCLWEASGTSVFSLADVATGADAGTYFGHVKCPSTVTASSVSSHDVTASW
jgi:hypothetical protein